MSYDVSLEFQFGQPEEPEAGGYLARRWREATPHFVIIGIQIREN